MTTATKPKPKTKAAPKKPAKETTPKLEDSKAAQLLDGPRKCTGCTWQGELPIIMRQFAPGNSFDDCPECGKPTVPMEPAKAKDKAPESPKANGKAPPNETERILQSFPRIIKLEEEYLRAAGRLKEAEEELDDAKDAVKTQQGNVDELNRKLHAVIDEIQHPEKYPLYNAPAMPNGSAKDKSAAAAKEDESWRTVPVREALKDLGKKVYEGMDKAKLDTLGKLFDWKNKDGGKNWWTDLEGVGKAASDKIDDAIEAFFGEWRKKAAPATLNAAHEAASAVKSVADATKPAPADTLEAARSYLWMNDAFGDLRALAAYKGITSLTVGDTLNAAKQLRISPIAHLQNLGFNLHEADMLLDAARKLGAKNAAKPTEPLKAGNSSQPAGQPLVPTKIETPEQLRTAVEAGGGKSPETPPNPEHGKSARKLRRKLHPEEAKGAKS